MGLSDGLSKQQKKDKLIKDSCDLVDKQIAAQSGLGGTALKAAFAVLQGIKPGYIAYVVEQILPASLTALDPIWSKGEQTGDPAAYLVKNTSDTADALLSVTDERIKNSSREPVKKIYQQFRNSAKGYVEQAVPDLAKIIDDYAKP